MDDLKQLQLNIEMWEYSIALRENDRNSDSFKHKSNDFKIYYENILSSDRVTLNYFRKSLKEAKNET